MDQDTRPEHFDVLIIGAGISGIDAGYHLQRNRSDSRFAILETKGNIGGTWHTHRFPGIRSDSDLFTFGFKWKPWLGVPIATAEEIMKYLTDAVAEHDLEPHIRFNHLVKQAHWNSAENQWRLVVRSDQGLETITCRFLWMCAGYYRHDQGYMPDFPGRHDFEGPVVHPQQWPEDLEIADKSVVVIGSGATAATLIPALAKTAANVTMLQRSPTYFIPRPQSDEFTQTLRALKLPDDQFHDIMRRRNLHESEQLRIRTLENPETVAAELIEGARAYLGEEYDVETHFTPKYRPWEQRIALVPDGDFFQAIASGKANVVTGHIERFTKQGIALIDGTTLTADIIVSATGLLLNALGDIDFEIDGVPLELNQSITHRGIMFSDIPNLVNVFGYLRSSWTLRADLVSDYVCRLLDHMETIGAGAVTPRLRPDDLTMTTRPWIDSENFSAGYIKRRLHLLPQQGDREPWIMTQDYFKDRVSLPAADFEDGTLEFSNNHRN
ncbi:MAG: NAD(P)/FAD-dependent oxidoreductase [Sulfitobacter sp.]